MFSTIAKLMGSIANKFGPGPDNLDKAADSLVKNTIGRVPIIGDRIYSSLTSKATAAQHKKHNTHYEQHLQDLEDNKKHSRKFVNPHLEGALKAAIAGDKAKFDEHKKILLAGRGIDPVLAENFKAFISKYKKMQETTNITDKGHLMHADNIGTLFAAYHRKQTGGVPIPLAGKDHAVFHEFNKGRYADIEKHGKGTIIGRQKQEQAIAHKAIDKQFERKWAVYVKTAKQLGGSDLANLSHSTHKENLRKMYHNYVKSGIQADKQGHKLDAFIAQHNKNQPGGFLQGTHFDNFLGLTEAYHHLLPGGKIKSTANEHGELPIHETVNEAKKVVASGMK